MAVSAFILGCSGFAQEALALDDFAFPVPADPEGRRGARSKTGRDARPTAGIATVHSRA